MTQNDMHWQQYFDSTKCLDYINQNNFYEVDAVDLKRITGREPRLLAKIDTFAQLPNIFRENNVSILPIRNGKYLLFKDDNFRSFYSFQTEDLLLPIETYNSNIDLTTFSTFPGYINFTESQSLDFGLLSSLFKTYISGEDLFLTIRGRRGSSDFSFILPPTNNIINVSGVQIEIDGGYESENKILLIEAKSSKREDFNIRQLFYPFLDWRNRTTKTIIPVLLIHSNGAYFIYKFQFTDVFGDIVLIEKKCVALNAPLIGIPSLYDLLSQVIEENEPNNIPFPQADDIDKVIDVLSAIEEGYNTKELIAEYFEFDYRQGDYYANAARYLAFVERRGQIFINTNLGRAFLHENNGQQRTKIIITELLKKPSFRRIIRLLILRDMQINNISNKEISEIILDEVTLSNITADRRASTVRSWLRWISNHVEH